MLQPILFDPNHNLVVQTGKTDGMAIELTLVQYY